MKNIDRFHLSEKKIFLLISLMILIFRIPTFYQPVFDIDETFFAEFAKKILSGGIPFVDAVDNKSPLLLYYIALIFKIFGSNNLVYVHIVTSFVVIMTAYIVFLCGKTIKNTKTGLWGAFIFAVLAHVYEPKNISTNIETLSNLFTALTFLFYLNFLKNQKKLVIFALLTGLSIGLGTLVQWQLGILAILLIFYGLSVEIFGKPGKKINLLFLQLKFLIITGFFTLLPIVLMSLYFIKLKCFDAFLFWTLEYNFTYAKTGDVYVPVTQLLSRVAFFIGCSLPVWFYFIQMIRKNLKNSWILLKEKVIDLENKGLLFLIFALFLMFYLVTLGKRAYGHYFLLLFIPLSLSVSIYLSETKERQIFKIILMVFMGLIFTVPRINLDLMAQKTGNSFRQAEIEFRETADFLKRSAQKNDKILSWGFATPIYYYSNLSPATRFLSSDTLVGRLSIPDSMKVNPQDLLDKNPYSKMLWDLFWQDFDKNPPAYIIDTSPANHYGYGRFPIQAYPKLGDYLKNNYQEIKKVNQIVIYQRKN